MKQVSGEDLARAVERRGWVLARVNGSHHIYVHEGSTTRLSIPIHGSRPMRTGLLTHLLKQADLTIDDV